MKILTQLTPLTFIEAQSFNFTDSLLSLLRNKGFPVHKCGQSLHFSCEEDALLQVLKEGYIRMSQTKGLSVGLGISKIDSPHKNAETPLFYQPIGTVENAIDHRTCPEAIRAVESRILINPALSQGLTGIEAGQRILIIYDFHRSETFPLLQHPRGDQSQSKRGVFALRSPNRPNSIGVSEVEVTSVKENILHVRGLDALNQSPVLDIKPA